MAERERIYYFKKDEKLSFTQPEAKQTHKLIIGDNYKALINLQQEYQGKIKMIYIDPPYGKDSIGRFAQTNYKNNITRDNLLSMLEPRLRLARNLLSDDGVIFCSIDDKNQAYVKILFDEVFVEKNFVCNIVRKTKTSVMMQPKNNVNTQHDYVIVFARKIENIKLYGDEKDLSNYTNPDNDPNGAWVIADPSTINGNLFEIQNPYTKQVDKPPIGRGWIFTKEKMQELIKNGKLVFKKDYGKNERGFILKRYKKDLQSTYNTFDTTSLLDNNNLNAEGTKMINAIFNEGLFNFPKPVYLLQQLIKSLNDKQAIILDFFAGSGTTGQAVLEQNKADGGNRQFILVQLDEEVEGIQKEFCEKNNLPLNLASITYERLKRVMTGKASDGSNFKWLEKNEKLGDNLLVYKVHDN